MWCKVLSNENCVNHNNLGSKYSNICKYKIVYFYLNYVVYLKQTKRRTAQNFNKK